MNDEARLVGLFADYLADQGSVAHAAAMLGKQASWGWEVLREICRELGVPDTYEGDLVLGLPPHRAGAY